VVGQVVGAVVGVVVRVLTRHVCWWGVAVMEGMAEGIDGRQVWGGGMSLSEGWHSEGNRTQATGRLCSWHQSPPGLEGGRHVGGWVGKGGQGKVWLGGEMRGKRAARGGAQQE